MEKHTAQLGPPPYEVWARTAFEILEIMQTIATAFSCRSELLVKSHARGATFLCLCTTINQPEVVLEAFSLVGLHTKEVLWKFL